MSVYDGERYVESAIRSVLRQTFEDFELIVVDDGSTDKSREIAGSIDDRRIRVIGQDNQGLTKALIRACAQAKGDIIARQDADDISIPDRFAKQLDVLESDPSIVAVGTDRELIDGDGRSMGRFGHPVRDSWLRTILALRNEFGHGTLMMRAAALDRAGGYDAGHRYAQDFELLWRLAEVGKVYNHPEVLYYSRKHERAISSASEEEQRSCADGIRLRNTREWLRNPAAIRDGLNRIGGIDPVADRIPDDWARDRQKRFAGLLGQMGIALLISNRTEEARWVLGKAGDLGGPVSRERLAGAILNLAPGVTREWARRRSRGLDLYTVYLNNDLD
jgi:glycosyltransferase involved in cell wall biosynthesis